MTEFSFEQVVKIIELAQKFQVEEISLDTLKVKFKRDAQPLKTIKTESAIVPDVKPDELVKPLSVLDQMTSDEILYYATPYYDELQAQKEAQAKKMSGDIE
jgi:hypothetical protein